MGMFYGLSIKCAVKGNMAGPQQHSSKLETKAIAVYFISAEKFCGFFFCLVVFAAVLKELHVPGLPPSQ